MARTFALSCLLLLVAGAWPARAQPGFAGWAAIVVAGDYHSHSGAPSEVFDNARRDVSAGFERLGVDPGNLEQFSVRPNHYRNAHLQHSDAQSIADALWDLSDRTRAGCLVYMSSHGTPGGMVLGDEILRPKQLEAMLNNSCADRPTVVIISACFSGVFVPELRGPNRFVLTAARRDRTSFGCGDNDRYPFFDDCVLESLPRSNGFPSLAKETEACVARKEAEANLSPPSDPQLSVGANVLSELPRW
jgi:hypothetical protein